MDKPMAVPGGILNCRSQKGVDPAAFFQPLPLPSSASWIWAKLNFSQPSWLASGWIWSDSWDVVFPALVGLQSGALGLLATALSRMAGLQWGRGWQERFSEVSKGGDVSKDQSQVFPIVLPVLYPGDLET